MQSYGEKNLHKCYFTNYFRWGSDAKHNILYIVGWSGSGKSTTANYLAKENGVAIHLDAYSERPNSATLKERCPAFDAYLDSCLPDWHKLHDPIFAARDPITRQYSSAYWNLVDDFRHAVEQFSRLQYHSGNRVIVEGVQLIDGWYVNTCEYYRNRSIAFLKTNRLLSFIRASKRDGSIISRILDRAESLYSMKEGLRRYLYTQQKMNNMIKSLHARRLPWNKK